VKVKDRLKIEFDGLPADMQPAEIYPATTREKESVP
jgi:hypothetical protein